MSKEQLTSKQSLADRLRWKWADHGSGYNSDYTADLLEAADEIERLQRECANWKQLHENDEACIANMRSAVPPAAPSSKPSPERISELNRLLEAQDIYIESFGLRALSPYKIALAFERLQQHAAFWEKKADEWCAMYTNEAARASEPPSVTPEPDASGLTLAQLDAGKEALFSCCEDPSFDDVRRVIEAVRASATKSASQS